MSKLSDIGFFVFEVTQDEEKDVRRKTENQTLEGIHEKRAASGWRNVFYASHAMDALFIISEESRRTMMQHKVDAIIGDIIFILVMAGIITVVIFISTTGGVLCK